MGAVSQQLETRVMFWFPLEWKLPKPTKSFHGVITSFCVFVLAVARFPTVKIVCSFWGKNGGSGTSVRDCRCCDR